MGFFKSLLFGPQTKAECRKAIADKKVELAKARKVVVISGILMR